MSYVQDVSAVSSTGAPLVVDLDGTLLRTDLLVESAIAFVAANPLRLLDLLKWVQGGKAALKAGIAAETEIDPSTLPYDERVLARIAEARAEGRKIYIASASNERYVEAVAEHLGVDGWHASDARVNLSREAKADRLVAAFGEGGFDYIGNDRADIPVWARCRDAIAVHPSPHVRKFLGLRRSAAKIIEPRGNSLRAWMKLVRLHQWSKNALVFVPLLTSHELRWGTVLAAAGAFVAFSFAASAVYILNDLVDLEADRTHPSKKRRPLASGAVQILAAPPVAAAMLAAAFAVALAVAPLLAAVLLGYVILTTAYTFSLKRKMLVDVVTLAMLYTIRVIGGGAATSVHVSEWLLAFSMLIFTSLALIKRYVELAARADADRPDPTNRNYRKTDLDVLAALAAASGFNGVTVFALYVSSDSVRPLYRHPDVLWLICPIFMYWIARALLMAHRRMMDDDPILFALRDRNSMLAIVLVGIILFVAI